MVEKSWSIRPTEFAARTMLKVELGQGRGRERMEEWFSRAMELDPDDEWACNEKLWYLRPRWHGNYEAMMAFGRECVQHPRWRVPLTMVVALENIADDFSKEQAEAFWWRPDVWADVKAAYERYFELFPNDTEERGRYFKAAYRSRAWKDMKRQFPKLRAVPWGQFGGPQGLAEMMSEMREHL